MSLFSPSNTISVQSTKDYSVFRTLFGNRPVNPHHVKNLVESIGKRNLMGYQPVLVTKDMKIIDGQHRVEAAKILKIPVHFTIIPESELSTVQMLNSNSKSWTLRNFCTSYAERGNQDYITLLEFADNNELPITTASNLLAQSRAIEGGTYADAIRTGQFKVKNLKNAELIVEQLKALKPYTNADEWRHRTLIAAIVMLYSKGMKHDLLIKQLQFSGRKIYRQATVTDYSIAILDIYNRNLRKGKGRINLI